jgi:hypothetical protein
VPDVDAVRRVVLRMLSFAAVARLVAATVILLSLQQLLLLIVLLILLLLLLQPAVMCVFGRCRAPRNHGGLGYTHALTPQQLLLITVLLLLLQPAVICLLQDSPQPWWPGLHTDPHCGRYNKGALPLCFNRVSCAALRCFWASQLT